MCQPTADSVRTDEADGGGYLLVWAVFFLQGKWFTDW